MLVGQEEKKRSIPRMVSPTLSAGGSGVGRPFQCADCSADDPQWASLNKGVLICSECCYVHRNLGRHVSQVRSLKKGVWDSKQLELMYVLYSNGSNNIWEHSLLHPQSAKLKRKPTPNDPVLPTKENFIKAKYAKMTFTLRPVDDVPLAQEDLNRQLWSCVRTAHVETALRLLVLGANPNYVDAEKHNSPLHVAAKEGQALQVELLWIYGADAGQLNAVDLMPSQVAKLENHLELAARLQQLQFEVTNRLTMYLCGRRPDHAKQQYFLIPELIGQDTSKELKRVRRQLCTSPAHHFERIIQDVYDEVDRRETVAAWNASMQGMQPIHLGNDQCVAVFLPPNPELSATRNQMRQKLAKCDVREFATLIIDVLGEAKRRYLGLPLKEETPESSPRKNSLAADNRSSANALDCVTLPSEGRDYDDVADSSHDKSRTSGSTKRSSDRKSDGSGNILEENTVVSVDDFLELKEKVLHSESTLTTVQQANTHILKMLTKMQSSVDKMSADNVDLHSEMKKLYDAHTLVLSRRQPSPVSVLSPGASCTNIPLITRSDSVGQQSTSSCKPPIEPLHIDSGYTMGSSVRTGRRHGSLTSPSGYGSSRGMASGLPPPPSRGHTTTMHRNGSAPPMDCTADGNNDWRDEQHHHDHRVPAVHHTYEAFPDNLIAETELLTHAIKLLLTDAQDGQLANRAPDHAHSIALLVNRIWGAVPEERRSAQMQVCLTRMSDATVLLSAKCNAPSMSVDETCNAAYAVAKSAKKLLVSVHRT